MQMRCIPTGVINDIMLENNALQFYKANKNVGRNFNLQVRLIFCFTVLPAFLKQQR